MSAPFIAQARDALRLTEAQLGYLRAGDIRSFEELHSVLRASPSAAERMPWLAAPELLKRLEAEDAAPILSEAYRKFLATPMDPLPQGAVLPPVPTDAPPFDGGAPPDWPALGKPASLAGEARADLLGPVIEDWPVRNQGRYEMACIGFSAAAAMERARLQPGAATPPALSAVFIYKRIFHRHPNGIRDPVTMAVLRPPGAQDGPTKLAEAREVLSTEGVCERLHWPDDAAPVQPGQPAIAAAAANILRGFDYWDLPDPARRPDGVARSVLELLRQGRPVAVSLPEFRDPTAAQDQTNWRLPHVRRSGKVADKQQGWEQAPTGHSVCILGFEPDPLEPLGGWFIFRNSWGLAWAGGAPDDDDPARVPRAGYGALRASHVDAHVWEIFSPGAT